MPPAAPNSTPKIAAIACAHSRPAIALSLQSCKQFAAGLANKEGADDRAHPLIKRRRQSCDRPCLGECALGEERQRIDAPPAEPHTGRHEKEKRKPPATPGQDRDLRGHVALDSARLDVLARGLIVDGIVDRLEYP